MSTYRGSVLLLVIACTCTALAANDMTLDELVNHNLDSIGTAQARQAAKSRVIEGTAAYRILVGGAGQAEGKAVLVSEQKKLQMMLKVDAQRYHGERFICDGKKTSVAGTYDDHSRSELGELLRAEDAPLREGLLGGELSTSWVLLDRGSSKGKFQYEGLKKVDGRDLYAIGYKPKKGADLKVTMYFEPETFHHVLTLYEARTHAGIGMAEAPTDLGPPASTGPDNTMAGGTDIASARQQETRYRIEERFGDFKAADGLTLPSHYELRFTEELQSGFTKSVLWTVEVTRVLNNVPLDARNFEVK
jgi:hypothetical protein